MGSKAEAIVKPWCVFCGMDIGRPTEASQRKLSEFPMGKCECGAVYVCDATGHNVGAAMVECLVSACNDEWDLAWELTPEDDYQTGRLEDYDDVTHQIVPKRNLDGRACRGVLYFVRLQKGMAEIVDRFEKNQKLKAEKDAAYGIEAGRPLPDVEPERDPKRKKKRGNKKLVLELALAGDIDTLVDLGFDDRRTLRFLQRLLYEPDKAIRYKIAWTIGLVSARLSTREPGPVADLMHRLFESSADSASASWGMVEAIGAVIANRPDMYGGFTRHLYSFAHDPATLDAVLWGFCEIAVSRPDLVRKTPFYSLFPLVSHEDPEIRALIARLLGRMAAKEAGLQLVPLQNDTTVVTLFDQGTPFETTVARQAAEAIERIHKGE